MSDETKEIIKDVILDSAAENTAVEERGGEGLPPLGVETPAEAQGEEKEQHAEVQPEPSEESKQKEREREHKKQSAKERIQQLAREKNYWRDRALVSEQEGQQHAQRSPGVAPESNIPAALAQHDARTAAAEQQRVENEIWETKIDAERDRYPDFEAVAYSKEVPYSPVMVQAVREHAHGVDIAYHLGKNPDEARRIAQLPPMQAAMELAEIGAQFRSKPKPAQTPAKRETKAPPPMEPLKGTRAGAQGVDLATADMDTYFKARMAQMYPNRKR